MLPVAARVECRHCRSGLVDDGRAQLPENRIDVSEEGESSWF